MAIRRPNKPAEEFEPEELFAVDDGSGSGTTSDPNFASGFPLIGRSLLTQRRLPVGIHSHG